MLEVLGESGARETLVTDDDAFRDTLRGLSCGVQLSRAMVEELQRSGPLPTVAGDQRRFVRYHCAARGILHLRQTLPCIPRQPDQHLVLSKNVSRSGVGFLHEAQLFPRERFQLQLEGGPAREIEITRCRRLQAKCYEIGAVFV